MDTKLKKTFKLKNLMIALVVLMPALILVLLYPKTEEFMNAERDSLWNSWEEQKEQWEKEGVYTYALDTQTFNYAMEASYYIYGQLLEESGTENVNFDVLQEYGWIKDYHHFYDNAKFIATYETEDEQIYEMKNVEGFQEDREKISFKFDAYGNLSEESKELHKLYLDDEMDSTYSIAMNSEAQYRNNVDVYNEIHDTKISVNQLLPKNFTIEFSVDETSAFVQENTFDIYDEFYYPTDRLWLDMGAIWIVLFMVAVVAIAALLMPAIRCMQTGRERLFMLPMEVMIVLGIGGVGLGTGMCFAMAYSTMYELKSGMVTLPQILGYKVGLETFYLGILFLNFIGWATSFFAEYIVVSCLRNLIMHPIQYVKEHSLIAAICRWIWKCCKKVYHYVIDININEKLNSNIVKIVLVNLIILTALCCLWFFGIIGVVLYSIGLYIVLRKYGEKLQKQYHSILYATRQMADGDLKISMEEDLGVFAPIGESLEEVQQGFQKAVIEEAKSQQMKSELITNVSHDLKTPLTAIITYVDLLKKEDLTEEERTKYISTLDQKSQRLKVLIEDLFEVSKAQSGNVKMNFMEVDVVSLLKQVRSELSENFELSNLQFRWNLPDEKIILMLDGQRMYRVFENLLSNILKYAMPQSRVYVDLTENDTNIQIQFRNVSAVELDFDVERLTDRFVRGDLSRNTDGNGLGLAIAKSFVELQNGTFHIQVDGDLFKVIITFDKV